MMSPEDTEKFKEMIKKGTFNQNSYDKLLKRFELENIDMEAEYTKIVKKESNLSRRQRDLIPDFLTVRDMIAEHEKEKETAALSGITTTISGTVEEIKPAEKIE